jgi:hypothetical protein
MLPFFPPIGERISKFALTASSGRSLPNFRTPLGAAPCEFQGAGFDFSSLRGCPTLCAFCIGWVHSSSFSALLSRPQWPTFSFVRAARTSAMERAFCVPCASPGRRNRGNQIRTSITRSDLPCLLRMLPCSAGWRLSRPGREASLLGFPPGPLFVFLRSS